MSDAAKHRRALVTLVAVAVGVVLVDQAAKAWAVAVLEPRIAAGQGPIPVLGDLLALTYYENPGASFGIGSGMTWIFTAVAMAMVAVIVRVSRRIASLPWAIGLGALLGGAVGNLIDRLAREPSFGMGHVIDFLAFGDWFVNNLADIAITGGVALIVVLMVRGIEVDGSQGSHAADGAADKSANRGADRAADA